MKYSKILLPFIGLLLMGCTPKAQVARAIEIQDPDLLSWLNVYDVNYVRDTQMQFSPEAYQELTEIQNGLNFPFTATRRTLWDDNKLYMTSIDEAVNAGYYSVTEDGHPQLYRYVLPKDDPKRWINSTIVPEGFVSVKQTGYEYECNEFFTHMHSFRNKEWADKFVLQEDDSFVSEDKSVLDDFLAFTAPCFLNRCAGEEPNEYLHFTKARIYKDVGTDKLTFELYVGEQDYDKVSDKTIKPGLFSVADVYNAGQVSIPVLDAYLSK